MTAEVLVLGGGPAGAAAAIGLARAGREVVLLEREREPVHKVCGEFLSAEALEMLERLGVDVWALGAERIACLRLAAEEHTSVAELPFAAGSLTRMRLDEALLHAAENAGAHVARGAKVEALVRDEDRWMARRQDGALIHARMAMLASGKHDVRGHARCGGTQNDLVAFKQYWRLQQAQAEALRGHVELMLFPDGYGGLQMVEDGCANLCWVMRRERVHALHGDVSLMLFHMIRHCELLRERLRGAEAQLARPLAVSGIPYGMVRRETEPGLWCVGDQAAVIPSFTGDGMAIALRSGMLAAEMLVRGEAAETFQRTFAREAERQVRFAARLSRWIVQPEMQTMAVVAASLAPGAVSMIARRTRLRVS